MVMFFYNLIIYFYGFLIKLASFNNVKAKQWVEGRKKWKKKLQSELLIHSDKYKVWVHCASYGEFEQGKPLIEAIKNQNPNHVIILSFFSPSGYERFKLWDGAEVVCYLPLDTKTNARNFLEIIKPNKVFFIKYEFWINMLTELKKQHISTYLISAVFKTHHPFFKWYGSIFRKSLLSFDQLFIQDINSGNLLNKIGILNYSVCGDSRFDRVIDVRNNFKSILFFDEFCGKNKILIAGSTWPKDDELLINSFMALNEPELKLILVPHEVNPTRISNLTAFLQKHKLEYQLYTEQKSSIDSNILIVDTIGLLSKLYHYADLAYIGGGFNSGIHNCLEAAVYFKPILFYGNDFNKYNEAVDLINLNAAYNVNSIIDLNQIIKRLLSDKTQLDKIKHNLKLYIDNNSGATEKVMSNIKW